jgi:hypothetical protein
MLMLRWCFLAFFVVFDFCVFPEQFLARIMADGCDVLRLIIQILAMLIDCCGIAATIWFLVGIPQW